MQRATKNQLYQIAVNEQCGLDLKYEAARELQRRNFSRDTMLIHLVRLWPNHTASEIAQQMNIPFETIIGEANKYGLTRVGREKVH